jgi:hypothetical protein
MIKYFEQSIMTVVMLAIFASMVGISFSYPPEARFMVLVVGLPAIALCLLQLGIDYRKQMRTRKSGSSAPDATPHTQPADGAPAFTSSSPLAAENYAPDTVRRELILWAYFLGLTTGVLLFGFYVTVPIFLFTFLLLFAQVGLLRAAIYTASACAFLYVLFDYVFRMPLHTGFVTDYLMDLISG